tara:strand:- start:269 stop:769 length:501 start_codon:yes stop_codon:yes gene_type:complete
MEIQLLNKIYLYKKLIPVPKETFIKDIDEQISLGNLCKEVPKYQTYNDLYDKMKQKTHWKVLYKEVLNKVMGVDKNVKLHSSWANILKKDSSFADHTHDTDLTAIYYLKNKYPEFGTSVKNLIVPGEENSLLIFNAKIMHSIVNIQPELYDKTGPRYSIVFDFVCQ